MKIKNTKRKLVSTKKRSELDFQYNCVGCDDVEELEYIIDHSRDISYKTWALNVGSENSREWTNAWGIPLYKDWAVSFFKSRLPDGRPVYGFIHSAIEYVFY
jgi:hypothetical protein